MLGGRRAQSEGERPMSCTALGGSGSLGSSPWVSVTPPPEPPPPLAVPWPGPAPLAGAPLPLCPCPGPEAYSQHFHFRPARPRRSPVPQNLRRRPLACRNCPQRAAGWPGQALSLRGAPPQDRRPRPRRATSAPAAPPARCLHRRRRLRKSRCHCPCFVPHRRRITRSRPTRPVRNCRPPPVPVPAPQPDPAPSPLARRRRFAPPTARRLAGALPLTPDSLPLSLPLSTARALPAP